MKFQPEFYDRHHWATKAEAKIASGRWIEERYNRCRRALLDRHAHPSTLRKAPLQTSQAA